MAASIAGAGGGGRAGWGRAPSRAAPRSRCRRASGTAGRQGGPPGAGV